MVSGFGFQFNVWVSKAKVEYVDTVSLFFFLSLEVLDIGEYIKDLVYDFYDQIFLWNQMLFVLFGMQIGPPLLSCE